MVELIDLIRRRSVYVEYKKGFVYSDKCSDQEVFDNIVVLSCRNKGITRIPLMGSLQILYCENNQIMNIPSMPKLQYLYCQNNPITSISYIPSLLVLDYWYDTTNNMTSFDVFCRIFDIYTVGITR